MKMYGVKIGIRTFTITLPYKEDGRWCYTTRYIKPKMTSTVVRAINPIPRWYKKSLQSMVRLILKVLDEEYKICQGCGTDEARWKIRDPNGGHGNEYYNCCDGCVRFYDWRMSRMKIIDWKDGKEVAVRKWD